MCPLDTSVLGLKCHAIFVSKMSAFRCLRQATDYANISYGTSLLTIKLFFFENLWLKTGHCWLSFSFTTGALVMSTDMLRRLINCRFIIIIIIIFIKPSVV